MSISQEFHHAIVLAGVFVGILLIAECWSRLFNPRPEWPRKLVHLGGGIVCIFIPYYLHSAITVFILAFLLSSLFYFGRKASFLKSLNSVERRTRGSEYYPIAIFIVYLLAYDKPWLYVCAVLVLAMADAAAALVGSQYGKYRFVVENETKSLEGSLIFLIIAFITIETPLLLLTQLPNSVIVLSAMLVAMIVTLLEAISLEGLDNLVIPLAVAIILGKITTKPVSEIIFQNISFILMCVLIAIVSLRSKAFNVGGALTVILFCFAAWSLGAVTWAIPVLFGYFLYVIIWQVLPLPEENIKQNRVRIIYRAVVIPFIILLLANFTNHYDFFFAPFLLSCAIVLLFPLWSHLHLHYQSTQDNLLMANLMAFIPWVIIILIPGVLFYQINFINVFIPLVILFMASTANFYWKQKNLEIFGQYVWLPSEWVITAVGAIFLMILQWIIVPNILAALLF